MFNTVAIIGVGLLGGSLARDLRRHQLSSTIVGVCRSEKSAQIALDEHLVDQVLPLKEAVENADLIVLATPMQAMPAILEKIKDSVAEYAVLTDVGSVKTDLYNSVKGNTPQLLPKFVFAHPIAGSENSGAGAAKSGLYDHKHVILADTVETNPEASEKVAQMWRRCGAEVVRMSLAEHDAIFAKTSHLPHMVAYSLVNCLDQQADRDRLFDLAAAGFYDFTRIASSDAEMWRDICITNKDQILYSLDSYLSQLGELRAKIARSDQRGILDYFEAAKQARDTGLSKKNQSSK
jgi:prephenate dehydrogenase